MTRFGSDLESNLPRAEGRQVALYKVKIMLEQEDLCRGDLRGQVKLGMTGQAEIVTDQESILMLLVRKIRQNISLG